MAEPAQDTATPSSGSTQKPLNPDDKPRGIQSIIDANVKGASRSILEDLFEDYFKHRYRIYQLNFVKGIFLGFGSVIGGTIMVALLIWMLSFFNRLPLIGNFVTTITNSIQSAHPQQRQ